MFLKFHTKIKLLLVLVLSFLQLHLWAQEVDFTKANELYTKGNYQEALKLYLNIEKQNKESFELYFNIGNCYYRLNEIAPSILYYERAKKFNPLNDDLIQNLKLASLKTTDRIESKGTLFFEQIGYRIIGILSSNIWTLLSLFFLLISAVLFYILNKSKSKQTVFIGFICSGLFFIITFLMAWQAKQIQSNKNRAVVFTNSLNTFSEPNNKSALLFTIHEGTIVEIKETNGDWIKIELATGVKAWVPKLSVRTI